MNNFGKGTSETFIKQSDTFISNDRYLRSRERKQNLFYNPKYRQCYILQLNTLTVRLRGMAVLTATSVQVMCTMKNAFYVQMPRTFQSLIIQWKMQPTWKYHEECSLFDNTIPILANNKRRNISIGQASPCTYCADMEDHSVMQPCSLKCRGEWHWNKWTGLIWGHSQTQLLSDPFKCRVKQQKVDNNQKSKYYVLH